MHLIQKGMTNSYLKHFVIVMKKNCSATTCNSVNKRTIPIIQQLTYIQLEGKLNGQLSIIGTHTLLTQKEISWPFESICSWQIT